MQYLYGFYILIDKHISNRKMMEVALKRLAIGDAGSIGQCSPRIERSKTSELRSTPVNQFINLLKGNCRACFCADAPSGGKLYMPDIGQGSI